MTTSPLDTVPMGPRIARLARDPRGFPIPFFVAYVDGVADFRVVDTAKLRRCVKFSRCWICGEPVGRFLCFAIGPMCTVNRVSSEPPSHYDCATYAVRVCPFLTRPRMRRNEKDIPAGAVQPAGEMLAHNPGATALWTTNSYQPFRAGNGVLFRVGDPIKVEWWTEGRTATREEVLAAMDRGLPTLAALAAQDGAEAEAELKVQVTRALAHLPEAA